VRRETYKGYWWGNLKESYQLGDPVIDGRVMLKWILKMA